MSLTIETVECPGCLKGETMERRMTITDYGKDYGFGRYCIESPGLKTGSNDYSEIARLALHFDEPCEGCHESPESCPGHDECEKTYGRAVRARTNPVRETESQEHRHLSDLATSTRITIREI